MSAKCEEIIEVFIANEIDPSGMDKEILDRLTGRFAFLNSKYYTPVEARTKIYTVGNPSSGKTTLVEALKTEGGW